MPNFHSTVSTLRILPPQRHPSPQPLPRNFAPPFLRNHFAPALPRFIPKVGDRSIVAHRPIVVAHSVCPTRRGFRLTVRKPNRCLCYRGAFEPLANSCQS